MNEENLKASISAIDAGAKMGTELIKTTRDFAGFCAKLTGLTDDSIIGLINDKIQFFRYNRQLRIAEEYNKNYGNQPMQPIPPKFLIPILENGSLEEDDDLQDLWINLLGAFTNKDYKEEKRLTYVEILKNLTPTDALILKELSKEIYKLRQKKYASKEIVEMIVDIRKFNNELLPKKGIESSLDNLIRLRCLTLNSMGGGPYIISLTHLGVEFLNTCMN